MRDSRTSGMILTAVWGGRMNKKKKPKHLFSLIYMGVTIVAIVLVMLFATDP